MKEITCQCGQLMADFDIRVQDGEFFREWYCFHCGNYILAPEQPTGDALNETQSDRCGAVTETCKPVNATEPLPPRSEETDYFSQFRGDE